MSGRQGGGRRGGRDTLTKENDLELDLLNGVLESIRKAKEYNDEQARLGEEILVLEQEIKDASSSKSRSGSSPEMHRKLDDLYRKKLRNAEAERKVHEEDDIINKLAILESLRSNDEPAPTRGSGNTKGRVKASAHRPIIESDVSVDGSGGVSPAETTASTNPRVDNLKRKHSSTVQRGSTPGVGRPALSAAPKDTASVKDVGTIDPEHRGMLAEKNNQLVPGMEVFYKYPKAPADDVGVGIQCVIKKIHVERKPIMYDVQDPEPDPSGRISVHRATAKDLYPIPSKNSDGEGRGVTFPAGSTVYARYPETDTFYKAKVVRGLKGGEYTLRFEGEEDDTEKGVERRYVLDTRMR